MVISVTNKHIKNGIRGSSCSCPVALAVKERGYTGVDILINICTGLGKFKVTDRVRNFMRRFDSGKSVKPINFKLIKA